MARPFALQRTVQGAAAGLLASWVMEKAQAEIAKLGRREDKEAETSSSAEPATYQVARKLARPLGVELSDTGAKEVGELVHYATGAGWGAIFGLLSRRWSSPLLLAGAAYGALVWLVNDEGLVPLLGLSKWP